MANRVPIVQVVGSWQQLQAGDTIDVALIDGAVDTTTNQNIGGLKVFTGVGGIAASNASGAQVIAASASGADAKLSLRSGAPSNKARWELTKNSTAESTGDVGSDCDLNALHDDGTFSIRVFRAYRATGIVDFTNTPSVGGVPLAKQSELPSSGTYTPTAAGVANVASVTPGAFHYIRVGNEVSFSGYLSIDPTASNTATQVSLTLPIASTLGNTLDDAAGTATASGITGVYGFVRSDGAGKLLVEVRTNAASAQTWRISGHYTIN
jgi:hypothetical protein